MGQAHAVRIRDRSLGNGRPGPIARPASRAAIPTRSQPRGRHRARSAGCQADSRGSSDGLPCGKLHNPGPDTRARDRGRMIRFRGCARGRVPWCRAHRKAGHHGWHGHVPDRGRSHPRALGPGGPARLDAAVAGRRIARGFPARRSRPTLPRRSVHFGVVGLRVRSDRLRLLTARAVPSSPSPCVPKAISTPRATARTTTAEPRPLRRGVAVSTSHRRARYSSLPSGEPLPPSGRRPSLSLSMAYLTTHLTSPR
jgi:hypothetical protein